MVKWIKDELEEFKRLYPISTKDELLEKFPNKTYLSLKAAAKRLKLKKDKEVPSRISRERRQKQSFTWKSSEIEILKKYYPSGGYKKVRELLENRDKDSIIGKANSLGLRINTQLNPWKRRVESIKTVGLHRQVKVTYTKVR